jgi:hypothetical protein
MVHDVNRQPAFAAGVRGQARRRKDRLVWDCTQVPFPNRTRLEMTEKPAWVLSDISI